MKAVAYGLLTLLYVLHTDVWYWDVSRIVLGFPIGFTYHVLGTIVITGTFWLVVRYTWPIELEAAEEHGAGTASDHLDCDLTSVESP